ncbi:MAG: hypothetical protein Q9216_002864 [Gyalolechia sp. 2 TL-2023]
MRHFPFRKRRSDESRQPQRTSPEIPPFNPNFGPNASTAIDSDRHGSSSFLKTSGHHDSRKRNEISLGPLGLNAIFTPKSSPKVDIVFIHGLGGASRKTWSKNGDPDLLWPQKFLPLERYICLSRIFTFGYNANFRSARKVSTSILDFAKDLLFDLKCAKGHEEEDLNIGKAYILGQNDPKYEAVIKAISAVTFLATPHRGTNLAESLNWILRSTFLISPKRYVSELGKNSFTLQKLNEQFRHIAPRLEIVSFYETQATPVGPLSVMILERDSSILGYPGEISRALDADHHNVCKYDGPHDPNYIAVRNALQSLIASIVSATEPIDDSSSNHEKVVILRSSLGITDMPDTDYTFFRDQWLQGTCEWVLNEKGYLEWFHSPTPKSSFLWMTGGAAAGKSVLSSFIINHIIEQGLCCQYFFIRFADRRKRTLSLLLRSIAYQIASSKPDLVGKFLQLRDQGIDFKTASPRTIWEHVFKAIILNIPEDEPMYWVIDGLDEADEPRQMIRLLLEVSQSAMPVRVLFVSRESSEIAASFQKVSPELRLNFVRIEGHREDLIYYIQQELGLSEDEKLRENVCETIARESQNNFLLPVGMQAFYDRMALSIAQKTDSTQRILASAILQYVTTALRVLTVTELSQALHEEAFGILDFQRSIMDVCSGFVVINQDGYVAMVHQTAREYLLDGIDRPFHVERSAAHKKIFLSCMKSLMTVGLRAKIDNKQQRVFLNYAASSWHAYLAATLADDEEKQNDDRPDQAQVIVKRELATSWAEDFAKIVGKFGETLRQDPGSIYKLVPPFCPPASAIYQQFGKMKDNSLSVSGFSNQNWDDSLARLSFDPDTYATSISAIGVQIATLVPSGTVFLHDSSNFEETVASPIKHGGRIYTMVSNTSATLLVTYGYHTIKLWQTRTGNCRLSVDNLQSRPRPLAMLFMDDDKSLLVGSDDRRIRALDLNPESPTWRIVANLNEPELEGHFLNSPNHMALDQKGKLVAAAYRGHPLSAWEIDGPVHIGHCWRTRDVLARGEVIEAVWHPHQPEILGLYIEGVIFRWRRYA